MVNTATAANAVNQEMWKTYLLVHKFIKILKRKKSSTSLEVLNPPLNSRGANNNHNNHNSVGHKNSEQNRSRTARSSRKSLGIGKKPKLTFSHQNDHDKQHDENHAETGGISPFIFATSFTRQLAFANVDEELNRRAKNSQARFYNSAWANLFAKISTVTVLLVTALLVILKLTNIMY